VQNHPARDDKDSARIAHELVNWFLDPQGAVPQEHREALLVLLKKRLYADAVDYFFAHRQESQEKAIPNPEKPPHSDARRTPPPIT
jgi:hypothetical protein